MVIKNLLHELQRRKVFRVVFAYIIVGWALIEVSSELEGMLELPDWTDRVFLVLIGLGLFVVIFLAWVFDITPHGIERTPSEPDQADSPDTADAEPVIPVSDIDEEVSSVCVLPFDDLTPEPDRNRMGDAISSEIHSTLSRMHRVRVAPRRSSTRYRDSEHSIHDVARELGVRYVLSGSMICVDNRIRVNAELDDAATGSQIWSERFERSAGDLLQVQQEISDAIVGAFGVARQRVEITGSFQTPTENLNRWGIVQRARQYLLNHNKQSIDEASALLQATIDRDPDYAAAHAALGSVLIEGVLNGYSDDIPGDRKRALNAAGRALELAPSDPFVLKSSGFTQALCGRIDDSLRSLKVCIDLAPYDFGAPGFLGWPLAARGDDGDFAEIQSAIDRLVDTAPDHPGSGYWLYHRSVALLCQGDVDAAASCMRDALDRLPRVAWAWMHHASILAASGDHDGAKSAADKAAGISEGMTPALFANCIKFMTENDSVVTRRLDGLIAAGMLSQSFE